MVLRADIPSFLHMYVAPACVLGNQGERCSPQGLSILDEEKRPTAACQNCSDGRQLHLDADAVNVSCLLQWHCFPNAVNLLPRLLL